MTSPRPEPLRVQPIALQIMLYQYNCHRVMGQCDYISRPNSIVTSGESGSGAIGTNIDRTDLPPLICFETPTTVCLNIILNQDIPPHLRLTRSGQCRKYPEHCHRNHYETSRSIGFLHVLCLYNSYSMIILGSPKSVVPMQGHALPPLVHPLSLHGSATIRAPSPPHPS